MVIVGGGAAGLSCAIQASAANIDIVVLDKRPACGGNSAKASSGINGALTEVQIAQGIEDSPALLKDDTMKTGGNISDVELVEKLSQDSADAIYFLKSLGLPLTDVILLGGHSAARTHRADII